MRTAVKAAHPKTGAYAWWKLHLSTAILLLPVLAILVLLVIPAGESRAVHSWSEHYLTLEHGWPMTWLSRQLPLSSVADEGRPWWTNSAAWQFFSDRPTFSVWVCVIDLACSAAVAMVVAVGLEYRRRRHARFWQFSLSELTLAVIALCASLAWWQGNRRQHLAELQCLDDVGAMMCISDYRGPRWLRMLLGARSTTSFDRVVEMRLFYPGRLDASKLEKFLYLQRVDINCTGRRVPNLAWLAGLKDLEYLHVNGGQVNDGLMRFIGKLTGLRELDLYDATFTDVGLSQLYQLQNLTTLTLRWGFPDHMTNAEIDAVMAPLGEGYFDLATRAGIVAWQFRRGYGITDQGLAEVARISTLHVISLEGGNYSLAGLKQLHQLMGLERLYIYRHPTMPPDWLEDMQHALPWCSIYRR